MRALVFLFACALLIGGVLHALNGSLVRTVLIILICALLALLIPWAATPPSRKA